MPLSFICFLTFIFSSCEKTPNFDFSSYDFSIKHYDLIYQIKRQADLNNFVTATLGKEVNFHSNLIKEGEDEEGQFLYIKAIYTYNKKKFSLVAPLNSTGVKEEDKKSRVVYFVECTMECIAGEQCSGCTQTIIRKCSAQTCLCNSGPGGCTSSIQI